MKIRSRRWGGSLLRRIIRSCLACRGRVRRQPSRRSSRNSSSEGRPCSSQAIPIQLWILSLLSCSRSTLKSCGLEILIRRVLPPFHSNNEANVVLQVHPDILKYTLSARPIPTSVEQLERQLLTPPVVATTCLSV